MNNGSLLGAKSKKKQSKQQQIAITFVSREKKAKSNN